MSAPSQIASQALSTPANLPPQIMNVIQQVAQLATRQMAGEQLPAGVAHIEGPGAQLPAAGAQQDHRDEINIEGARGVVVNPSGPVNETFVNVTIAAPASPPQNKAVEQYRELLPAVYTPAPKYNFPPSFHFVTAAGAPSDPAASLPLDQLIDLVRSKGLILLRGSAGSGKSTAMRQLVERLARDDQAKMIPIYLRLSALKQEDAERLGQELAEDAEPELYIEPLLACADLLVGSDRIQQLNDWAATNDGRILLIADGLNEVFGLKTASTILKRLTSYTNKRSLTTCILVTDRTAPRDTLTAQWHIARLEPLTLEVVRQQFQMKGIEAIYSDLGESDRTLLQTPYFLEYALDHTTARLNSPAEALGGFFKRLNLDDNALEKLSKAAYAAYAEYHSNQFDVARFTEIVGADTFDALEGEGVIIRIASDQPAGAPADAQGLGDQAKFDHQLKHDYLAARYLSQHDEEWNPAGLDALSFESNSFDALSMTLELLPDEAHADRFVERVYSWDWAAAFVCIAKAMRYGSGRHSQEMRMAVLALVVEKLFDPVQQTRDDALSVVALFSSDITAPYEHVGELQALCALVQQQVAAEGKLTGSEDWFPRWRDLFVRPENSSFSESDLKNIVDTKSIIGWTAANVFKRSKLSDINVRQLCAYYDACNACGPDDWLADMIRWRVAHALGKTDTRPVVDTLFAIMNDDRYLWARIGAARSLVEIAALTANDDLRQTVIARLRDAVDRADERTLATKTLLEIGQSAFYSGAQAGWEQAVTPLIETVCKRVSPSEQRWWLELLARFKDFCKGQLDPHPPASSGDSAPAALQPASSS